MPTPSRSALFLSALLLVATYFCIRMATAFTAVLQSGTRFDLALVTGAFVAMPFIGYVRGTKKTRARWFFICGLVALGVAFNASASIIQESAKLGPTDNQRLILQFLGQFVAMFGSIFGGSYVFQGVRYFNEDRNPENSPSNLSQPHASLIPPRPAGVGVNISATHSGHLDQIYALNEKFFASSFDKAKTYSQIIAGIGYAGIFAAWSFTKPLLSPTQIFLSAFLATISLIAYVLFEVISMYLTSTSLLRLAKALEDKSNFIQLMQEHEEKQKRSQRTYARIWTPIWIVSFGTGVVSAGILLVAFAVNLWTHR